MIMIAVPYARYSSTLTAADLERAAANLLEFSYQVCQNYFLERYQQLEVTVLARVEIGSTRTWITIMALAHTVIFYGEIRQSVDYLVRDAQQLGRLILVGIPESLRLPSHSVEREERRLGVPGQLQRLFASVERGEISPDEATRRALTILQRQGGVDVVRELPKLSEKFVMEFQQTEISLLRQLSVDFGQEASPSKMPTRRERQAAHRPEMGLPPMTPRQRRRGVIASRDRVMRNVQITMY